MQTARVVTMPVRQDKAIHFAQVDAQLTGIADEEVGRTGIEQYLMPCHINKQGKPMLSLQALAIDRILDKGGYLYVSVHAGHSTTVTHPCTSGSSPYWMARNL